MRSSIPSNRLFKTAVKQVEGFLLSIKDRHGEETTKIFIEKADLWKVLNTYQSYMITVTSIMACKGDKQ